MIKIIIVKYMFNFISLHNYVHFLYSQTKNLVCFRSETIQLPTKKFQFDNKIVFSTS